MTDNAREARRRRKAELALRVAGERMRREHGIVACQRCGC